MPDLVFPLTCWIGLAVGSAEVSSEIGGTSYARQPAVFAYEADPTIAANTAAVQFPVASHDWGTVTVAQIWNAAIGGTQLGALLTVTPVQVNQYDRLRIPPAGYQISVVRVPSGFGTGMFGVGRYNTRQWLDGVPSGIGSPYGVGPYGIGPYAALPLGVLLQKTFATVAMCGNQPGDWAPALCGCSS